MYQDQVFVGRLGGADVRLGIGQGGTAAKRERVCRPRSERSGNWSSLLEEDRKRFGRADVNAEHAFKERIVAEIV